MFNPSSFAAVNSMAACQAVKFENKHTEKPNTGILYVGLRSSLGPAGTCDLAATLRAARAEGPGDRVQSGHTEGANEKAELRGCTPSQEAGQLGGARKMSELTFTPLALGL